MSGINNVFYSLLLLFTSYFFVLDVNTNEWRQQGYSSRRHRCRRILPFPFRHCRLLHHCHRRRCCACDNLGSLLRYVPLIYPPLLSATYVRTFPAVPVVVPLPPLSVGVAADVTADTIGYATDPAALNPAYPAVFRSFCRSFPPFPPPNLCPTPLLWWQNSFYPYSSQQRHKLLGRDRCAALTEIEEVKVNV